MVNREDKSDAAFYEDLCNQYFEQVYFYGKRIVRGQG